MDTSTDATNKPSATFGKLHFNGEIDNDGNRFTIDKEGNCFKGNLKVGKIKSPATSTLYVTVTKIFFRWLAQENIYPNIADHLKNSVNPSTAPKKAALSEKQCAELVREVKHVKTVKGEEKHDELRELRDKAILSLMVTAGLRTCEVVRANVGDIQPDRDKIFLYVIGKGHSERDEDQKVLISKQTNKAIQAYLKARGRHDDTDPLFVSTSRRNKNCRLSTQTVRKMVKDNLRAMGLNSSKLTAHSLRHSVVTNLIFAGVALPKIQDVARHSSIATTMRYQHAYERYNNDSEQILADAIFC